MQRSAACGLVALLLLALAPPVHARTRRHRKPSPLTVALQPFLLARAVVHTVADPIVERAPRAIATVATAPIRIACHAARDPEPTVLRGEMVRARGLSNQSVRVAYLVPRTPRADQPEPEEETDQRFAPAPAPEREPEDFSHRPTVAGSRAVLRRGIAYAPSRTPQSVKNAS